VAFESLEAFPGLANEEDRDEEDFDFFGVLPVESGAPNEIFERKSKASWPLASTELIRS
jgi:hypothetical protein